MSALALYATVADNPSFWVLRKDAWTQTDSVAQVAVTQTEPCPFQTLGYAVVRRCPNPALVWEFVDTEETPLHCGVLMLTRTSETCQTKNADT